MRRRDGKGMLMRRGDCLFGAESDLNFRIGEGCEWGKGTWCN